MATPLGGSKVPRLSLGALQARNREHEGPSASLGLGGISSKIPLPQSARAPTQGMEQEEPRHQRPPLTSRGRPPLAAPVQFPVPVAGNSWDPTPRLISGPQKQQQQQRLPPNSARGIRPPASCTGAGRAGPNVRPTTPRNTYRDALVTPRGSQGAGASMRAATIGAAEPAAASSTGSGLQAARGSRSPSPLGRQQQLGDAVVASSSPAEAAMSVQAPGSQVSPEPHQQVPTQQQQQQRQEGDPSQPPPVMTTRSGMESSAEQPAAEQPEHHPGHQHQQLEEQQRQQPQDPEQEAAVLQQQEVQRLQATLRSHQAELQQRLSALADLGQQRSALAAQVAAAQQLCMQARQREEARRAELQDLDLASRTLAATLENYKVQEGASHTTQARLGLLHLMLAAARLSGTPVVAAAVEQEIESMAALASYGRSQPGPAAAELQHAVGSGRASGTQAQRLESKAAQVGQSEATPAPEGVFELPSLRRTEQQQAPAPATGSGKGQTATPVGAVSAHSSGSSSSGGYDAATPADSGTSTSSSSYGCSSGTEESCSTADSGSRQADGPRHSEGGILAHAKCAGSHVPRLPPLIVVPALQLGKGLSLGSASPRAASLRQDTAAAPPAAAGPAALPSARGALPDCATGDTATGAAAAAAAALAAMPCAGAGKAARATARAPAKLLLPGSPCLMTAVEAVGTATAARGVATPTGAGLVSGDGLRSPLSPLAMQRLQSIRAKFEAAECIMAAVVEQNVVL